MAATIHLCRTIYMAGLMYNIAHLSRAIMLCFHNEKKKSRPAFRHCDEPPHPRQIYTVCLLLFYAIATLIQLYHSGDMIYELKRRKPEPTLSPRDPEPPTPYKHTMRGTGLWWCCKYYCMLIDSLYKPLLYCGCIVCPGVTSLTQNEPVSQTQPNVKWCSVVKVSVHQYTLHGQGNAWHVQLVDGYHDPAV